MFGGASRLTNELDKTEIKKVSWEVRILFLKF